MDTSCLKLCYILNDRYVVVCLPQKKHLHFGKCRTIVCIVGVWMISLITASCWTFFTDVSMKTKLNILGDKLYYISRDHQRWFQAYLDITLYFQVTYVYYHPSKKEIRGVKDIELDLVKDNFTLVPESAMCMVMKTTVFFYIDYTWKCAFS